MEKSTEFTKNAGILIIGEIIGFVLSFGSGFLLIRFLSVEDYSIYNIVLVVYNPSLFCDTNISGTINLLNSAKKNKIKKYLQISTDEVYGSLNFNDAPFTENHQLAPNSPYSANQIS